MDCILILLLISFSLQGDAAQAACAKEQISIDSTETVSPANNKAVLGSTSILTTTTTTATNNISNREVIDDSNVSETGKLLHSI